MASPYAGPAVCHLFRKIEFWLRDDGLERSLSEGTAFATRDCTPDRFSTTAGVGMPVDRDLIESALDSAPHLLRRSHAEAIEDRRFAEAIYRAAIAEATMERMRYRNPAGTGDPP